MSEAQTGWFLRHPDGDEHGPFLLSDILSAAQAGNVLSDTCVRHPSETHDRWVFAPRIEPIAEAMGLAQRPDAGGSSAGRRPVQPSARSRQASSAKKSTGAATAQATGTPAAGGKIDPHIQTVPVIRSRIDPAFPVPTTFVDAVCALLDFRFRYFITPWIVKILWTLCFFGSILWLLKIGYDSLIQPNMPAPGPAAVADGNWEFAPLEGQSFLQSPLFGFVVAAASVTVGLLCARVALEGAIVMFRVASDFSELKGYLKERSK